MLQRERERKKCLVQVLLLLCLSIFSMVGTTCCIITVLCRSNSQLSSHSAQSLSGISAQFYSSVCEPESSLTVFRNPEVWKQTFLLHRLKVSEGAVWGGETANILVAHRPVIRLFLISLVLLPRDTSISFSLLHFLFSFFFFFSLLELRYSHQLIFTSLCLFSLPHNRYLLPSHSCPAHF